MIFFIEAMIVKFSGEIRITSGVCHYLYCSTRTQSICFTVRLTGANRGPTHLHIPCRWVGQPGARGACLVGWCLGCLPWVRVRGVDSRATGRLTITESCGNGRVNAGRSGSGCNGWCDVSCHLAADTGAEEADKQALLSWDASSAPAINQTHAS